MRLSLWWLLPVFAVILGGSTFEDETKLYVGLVPKHSTASYKQRLAGTKHDLIISAARFEEAVAQQAVNLKQHDKLYVVELFDDKEAKLPGEIARLDRYALVVLWEQDNTHLHMGDIRNFVVHVATQAPEIQPEPFAKSRRPLQVNNISRDVEIREEDLRNDLSEFSGAKEATLPDRTVTIKERGSQQGKDLARTWLSSQYEKLGFTTSLHTYRTGKNFVAEREGSDPSKILVVSAHLDSVGNAGADDDGAGTISALAIAKSLQGKTLKHNLRIVGFDEEERGLVGSVAYARDLSSRNELNQVMGVINIEMTGYDADGDGAFHAIHCNENSSKTLADAVIDAVKTNSLNLIAENACTNRSDHAAFWRHNVPAIVVSQNFFGGDSNPCYHASCDKVDKISFGYMMELTKAIAIAVHNILVEK